MKTIRINKVEWINPRYVVRLNVDPEEGKVFIELFTKNTYEYAIASESDTFSSKADLHNSIYDTAIPKLIAELEKGE